MDANEIIQDEKVVNLEQLEISKGYYDKWIKAAIRRCEDEADEADFLAKQADGAM